MVDVKSAISAARDYIKEVQPLLDDPLENLKLEEVELTEDEKHWLITLGYDKTSKPDEVPEFLPPAFQRPLREYKLFRINYDSGQVEAMKIRRV